MRYLEVMERRVYKYLRIQKAIDFLSKGRVTFVQLHTWSDPTEKAFSTATIITKDGHEVKSLPLVYALCVTSNQASEAAWVVYQHLKKGLDDDRAAKRKKNIEGKDSIVRGCVKFSIKFKEFLSQLDGWAKAQGYELYVSRVRYYDWKKMKTVEKLDSEFQWKVFVQGAPFIENYLRMLSLKREPYEYENEIRLFLVKWPNAKDKANESLDVAIQWKKCLHTDVYYGEECEEPKIAELRQVCDTLNSNIKVKESTLLKRRKHLRIQMPYYYDEIVKDTSISFE